jgi:RNA 3'-terminal phosphate cyclase (ATP)
MTNSVNIDGSQGEGGGQIVRSSLALSLVTGRPVTIENIRAGREKPGLMRQHLTAVRAAAEVGDAKVEGDEIGSRSLSFKPKGIRAGDYTFAVGTAGSATLVLQTVLPALLIADKTSRLTLEGGTHNAWAPPFDFLDKAFFPIVNRMGPFVSAQLERHGFFPAGGGRFKVTVDPVPKLKGLTLLDRGEDGHRRVTALVSKLPTHIGQREVDTVAAKSNWAPNSYRVDEITDSAGPGNVLMIEIQSQHSTEVFTGFGRYGVKAEHVAEETLREARQYLAAGVPVGEYLADQILLPLGIAAWQGGGMSQFRTLPLSRHATTHIDILRQFLGCEIECDNDRAPCTVSVGPAPRSDD